ncbi:MAG TPA: S41 family peptidase [Caulobacteraceae bacterium]|nr:S41 family peptidase [Caulobacteraceae bacterium]
MACKLRSMAAAVVLLAAGGAQAAPVEPKYERLFDAAWKAVDQTFYDPAFHGVNWKAVGARHRAKLAGVDTDAEFQALVSAMLAELKSSHLSVRPPSSSSARGVGPAVQVRDYAGRRVITEVAVASDAQRQTLRPGDVIMSGALSGPLGSTATLEVETCSGERRTVSVRREAAFWPPARPAFSWSQIAVRPGVKIGYLRVDRFDDGAAELIDAAMADLGGTSGLIIDVRNNSGGNTSALRLGSYFGDEAPAVVLLSRAYLNALGHPVGPADIRDAPKVSGAYTDESVFAAVTRHQGSAGFWTEDVGAKRYKAPVVVLTGEDTGSAAEGFAWYMRLNTHARLVGRPTAGALLSGETTPLGDGWSITIPVHGVWGPDGTSFNDASVPPHETVAAGREDLCQGRDADIARALDLLIKP